MSDIPSTVKLSSYAGGAGDLASDQLSSYLVKLEGGAPSIPPGPLFPFEQLREAHALMDTNSDSSERKRAAGGAPRRSRPLCRGPRCHGRQR